jgi:hypothetical protein
MVTGEERAEERPADNWKFKSSGVQEFRSSRVQESEEFSSSRSQCPAGEGGWSSEMRQVGGGGKYPCFLKLIDFAGG